MSDLIDLRPDHAKIVRDILGKRLPPGVKVRAFGSRAKWTAKAHSDLDLALKGDAPLSASLLADLAEAFSESDLPFKVDVVDWRAVGLGLQQAIDRDGVELNFGAGAGASMRPDWPLVELARLVEVERGISYGIVQPGAPVLQGVPIVRVADVKGGRIDTRSPLRVAKEIEASYSRTRLRGGELLITIVGSVGETAIVPDALAGWNVARAIAVLPVKKDIGAYWVQLALKAPTVRGLVNSRLNTTVQATLNLGDLAKLPMLLPPASERERIASILGALDDKIDLNRRMNETLEAMARTIFKDWFVDFGPTRAKIEGRPPYLAPDVWALLPDRLSRNRQVDQRMAG